jgi:hypothetical protein
MKIPENRKSEIPFPEEFQIDRDGRRVLTISSFSLAMVKISAVLGPGNRINEARRTTAA